MTFSSIVTFLSKSYDFIFTNNFILIILQHYWQNHICGPNTVSKHTSCYCFLQATHSFLNPGKCAYICYQDIIFPLSGPKTMVQRRLRHTGQSLSHSFYCPVVHGGSENRGGLSVKRRPHDKELLVSSGALTHTSQLFA